MAIAVTSGQRAWAESIRARGGDPGELRAVALPEELGGAGGTVTDLAVGLEEAAAVLAPGPLLGSVLAGLILARRRDSALAKELVPALADGSARAAVAFGPGSVVATPAGQGFFLRGRTDPVLDAEASAHLVVATDLGWFVLPPQPVEPAEGLDLSRDVGFFELALGVPRSALLDDPPVLDLAATLAAAEASGIARWCVRTAREYAGVREQFGRPIGSFQAVKHLCAQNAVPVRGRGGARAWDAARAGGDHPLAAAVAAAGALDAASTTRRTASRYLAASASPGSTRPTATCAGRSPCGSCSVVRAAGAAASRSWHCPGSGACSESMSARMPRCGRRPGKSRRCRRNGSARGSPRRVT